VLTRSDVDYVSDEHSAARLYLELVHQREQGGGSQTETTAAINKLTRTWPEARQLAAEASEDELGGLHAGLKRTRDAHRREHRVTSRDAATARARRRRQQEPGGGRRSPGRPSNRGGPARRSGGGARAAYRTARALSPGGGVADALIGGARIMLGLSLLYLILSNRGSKGFAGALRGVETAVNVFLRPVDPIGKGVTAAAAPTTAAPAPQRLPSTSHAAAGAIGAAHQVPALGSVLGAPSRFMVPRHITINRPPSAPAPGGHRPT
jgi:hypothetical protein